MSDRELLELAAKAAGYRLHIWGSLGSENVARMDTVAPTSWNPLTDDGDALRLANTMDMDVSINRVDGWTEAIAGYYGEVVQREPHGTDYHAATRRAIVRAAAEIGKAMP